MSKFLTVKDVMAETHLSYTTILEKIRKGDIKAHRLAHKILVTREDLDEWYVACKIQPRSV
jgi:excisionase family DNA binding protein